jgi:hypothetical protein
MEHEYGCHCERCKAIISSIVARDRSGEYFFSDDELEQIVLREEEAES